MTIVTFKPKGGGKGGEPPHIDNESYLMLVDTLIAFFELCIKEGDQGRDITELERLTRQLERLAERVTPPKGAA
ncbi:hypothetical protein SAMN04244579_02121 [Azotobacter beijerinckii]|jgi:hypothetical protein|uniref:Uncharacterized protein n=1 Tax=Azotobacter beijerinckii TaxID=170623 RepID=A0A1H6TYI3_9GAMM|nr:hypothetical protein [Azotobacter beijerinckii]SEI82317.1 hypothetical protein SAMN04244579_02121 [Azotobacter beijerinckii]